VTTAYIATTGGHLTQLANLAERIPPDADSVWVTHANEQSTSLLADRNVEYIPYVGVRDIPGVLRCVLRAHSLFRRRRPTRAVSTGSGIALGYLPYLAARGPLGRTRRRVSQTISNQMKRDGTALSHRGARTVPIRSLRA